ncbi:MAG: hypothetical protein EOP48_26335 [Sphingobacteriales bacterium]|nr:MAG: hypothetical protein EOP48_26335 [Sphingobacteriales bacterium]
MDEREQKRLFNFPTQTYSNFLTQILTKRIQKIFGKGISVSAIRSVYTSSILREGLKEVEEITDRLEQKASEMGTSLSMLMSVYYKNKV